MTRIRMLTSIAGPEWSAKPGDEVVRDAAEAARLVAAGFAELVPDKIETATAKAKIEKAVSPRGKK